MELKLDSPQGLTAAVTTVITVVAILIPQTRNWFASKDADTQKAIRGVGVLILAVVFVAGGCFGVISGVPCTVQAIGDYAIGVVLAAVLSMASTDGVFLVARKIRDARSPRLRSIDSSAGKLF